MTTDAYPFEDEPQPAIEEIRRNVIAGQITPAEAIDLAYGAGYRAGRLAEQEWRPSGRIVRVGPNTPPEVQS